MPEQTAPPVDPKPINSPLGQDPAADPTPPEPRGEPPATPAAKKMRQISEDELLDMQNKAKSWEYVQNDPKLSSYVYDHVRGKTGRVGPTDNNEPTKNEPKPVDATAEQIKALTNKLAVQEIQLFEQRHPDMRQYADDMKQLIANYGMSLDDAYKYAKAAKPQPEQPKDKQPPAGNSPPQPTVEVEGGDPEPVTQSEQELLAKIHDPKATPQLDDALDLAWKLAKQKSK